MTTLTMPTPSQALPQPTTHGGVDARQYRSAMWVGALSLGLAWPLGLVYLGWPLVSLVLVGIAVARRWTTVPRELGWWLLLLVLVLLSAAQVETVGRAMAFGYRFVQYLSATMLALVVYNARRAITLPRVMGFLHGALIVTVATGILGLVASGFHRPSLLLQVLPQLPDAARFISDTTRLQPAVLQNILDGTAARPKGVFAYTNDWAAVFSLLTVVLFAYHQRRGRVPLGFLAVTAAGLVPFVASLSRGAWVALALGVVAVSAVRMSRDGTSALAPALLLGAIGASVLLHGAVLGTVESRFAHGHSDTGRMTRVTEAVDRVQDRPLTGYGTPLPSERQLGPSVGTHGQFWLVLFCQGFPGAAVLVLWLLALLSLGLRGGAAGEVLIGALVVLSLQSLVYEWSALQLHVLLALVALAARQRIGGNA